MNNLWRPERWTINYARDDTRVWLYAGNAPTCRAFRLGIEAGYMHIPTMRTPVVRFLKWADEHSANEVLARCRWTAHESGLTVIGFNPKQANPPGLDKDMVTAILWGWDEP